MYGTLKCLIYYLSIYQQIFQVKQMALFLLIKIMLEYLDATPLNCNSFLPERTRNNSLISTFKSHDNLNGTRNLTQHNVQTPSHFVNEEIVEAKTTTEAKRSISPIQPNFTTPKLKIPTLQQTIKQSTVKPSVAQKYSQMDYQTFQTVTKPSYKHILHIQK